MNKDYQIYELTEEQRKALADEAAAADEAMAVVKEDVARLDGYLKGRADSDKVGPGSNSDLTRRRS